jgi:tetratricopeptide (TPR) repeat protein
MDYKKLFARFGEENFFIKTGARAGLDGAVKASLNRRGNVLFNQGDVEGARRIFITTGYSDGLCRIGDYYQSKGRFLDALKMYRAAPDHSKSEPIIIRLSEIIRSLINEKEDSPDD